MARNNDGEGMDRNLFIAAITKFAAGFVLDRLDGARQKVCAAWGEVPIADDASVLWNGRSWMLICGGSRETPIPLGGRISIGGRSFDVQPFHQTHLN